MAARAQDIGIMGEYAATRSIDVDVDRVLDRQIAVFNRGIDAIAVVTPPPAPTLTLWREDAFPICRRQLSTSSTTSKS
jgi:hypothetical protein